MSAYAGPGGKVVGLAYDSANILVDSLNGDMTAGKLGQVAAGKKADQIGEIANQYGKKGYGNAVLTAKVLINSYSAIQDIVRTAEEGRTAGSGTDAAAKQLKRMLTETEVKI